MRYATQYFLCPYDNCRGKKRNSTKHNTIWAITVQRLREQVVPLFRLVSSPHQRRLWTSVISIGGFFFYATRLFVLTTIATVLYKMLFYAIKRMGTFVLAQKMSLLIRLFQECCLIHTITSKKALASSYFVGRNVWCRAYA